MFKFKFNKTHFSKLSDKHVLALAIYAEEEDSKIYFYFANTFKKEFPETAKLFDEMGKEENEHRKLLIDLYKKKFGSSIPIVKREHVSGFYKRKPIWLIENLKLDTARDEIRKMENDAAKFYFDAAQRTSDPSIRKIAW